MNNKQCNIRQNDETMRFDFEEWAELAVRDPDAFEARRLAWSQRLIDSAPAAYQRRLSGLLFQINMEKRRSANAVNSCMRISRMMWDRLHELRGELQSLVASSRPQHPAGQRTEASDTRFNQPTRKGAKVINLHTTETAAVVGNR